ncbi:hypothetical protein ANSO36C_04130 [Nostoc cf. commune SO-36]|uniref:Sulfatase-modifying factor protein n=1 Tax=Nostoc cf. commune SO-36 TaxID=449208 RepID=A0ABM7YVF2_NOSCO|nr:SUMF1/EgtB/PvdO family nonheme iron enzyme [Nostoc commune]BDI14611.1 hypothetical protein ANSO36C_04130 [Nostoc cf. commune SO-36]
MVKKIALLIGISEYEPGLAALPKAVNDVEAMERVLVNTEIGGFAPGDVTVLKNPQKPDMEREIYNFYANSDKDDLLLLYFSGHGVTLQNGDFYFSTRGTQKNQNQLLPYTAIVAKYVHDSINSSKSKRQVVILDCCFSAAFARGVTAKDIGVDNIDLQKQLGGEGRAILTACTSTQKAYESDDSNLSIYTKYLIEGLEKGTADKDGDGLIAVDELHDFAKSKVQEESPDMTPELYYIKKGEPIFLAKSPKDDPKLKYRKEVEIIALDDEGEISDINRDYLDEFRKKLKSPKFELSVDDANAIEFEVLEPYRKRQEKLQRYEQTFSRLKQYPPSQKQRNALKRLQDILSLREEDVAPIEARFINQQKPSEPVLENEPNQFEFDIVKVDAQGQTINSSKGRAKFFRESLGNDVVLEMVSIPGGEFLMGSPESEPERTSDESPQHSVTIQPFFMGKFPVTQSQWKAVAALPKVNIDLNPEPSNFQGANRPVEQVSWDDAIEFCARLSKKTQETYRLPSEAEWEYACRAGTTTPFYFGETITTDLANYQVQYGETTDVGKFPANPFGLFDMHGNIWEWCQDEWHKNYNGAPKNGSAWLADNNQDRLLRGGSWLSDTRSCRSAYRGYYARVNRNGSVGFRVVLVRGRT